ncbi:MAG: biopolymer transporter ExbD [Planctomycetaceae bacterium]|nr:biopolymer transporter ExbD [Planctomycetaceae bacterium]
MKFVTNRSPTPPGLVLAPLVAVALILLMVFLIGLPSGPPERRFVSNLPLERPRTVAVNAAQPADIKVSLLSDAEGNLAQIALGTKNLGNDDAAFDRLNAEILKLVVRPGNPLAKNLEIEIAADYELHYRHVIRAVATCTGRVDPQTKQMVRYIEKIKFAPPQKPKGEV